MNKHTATMKNADTIDMLKKKIAESKIAHEVPQIVSDSARERSWIPLYSRACD